ncbi:MAG: hypothetical protein ACRC23_02105 [Aeromonas jandaei]
MTRLNRREIIGITIISLNFLFGVGVAKAVEIKYNERKVDSKLEYVYDKERDISNRIKELEFQVQLLDQSNDNLRGVIQGYKNAMFELTEVIQAKDKKIIELKERLYLHSNVSNE